jgi:hypothetical protein
MKILNPVIQVPLDNGKVEVRQLPFLKAIEFLKKLAGISASLFTADGKFRLVKSSPDPSNPSAASNLQLDIAGIQEVINQSGDLAEFLILNSTAKDRAWLESLSLAEGMTVLEHALRANTAPEILALGNGIAGVLKGLRKPATSTSKPSST